MKRGVLSLVIFLVVLVNVSGQMYYSERDRTFLFLYPETILGFQVETVYILKRSPPLFSDMIYNVDKLYNFVDNQVLMSFLNSTPSSDEEKFRLGYMSNIASSSYGMFRKIITRTSDEVVQAITSITTDTGVSLLIVMPDGTINFRNMFFTPQK